MGIQETLMGNFAEFHARSINDRDAFWAEQAKLVDWKVQPQQICDYSNPPFAKWFVGGETNLCHNAVDRHLADRADQPALIFVSTETDQEKTYTYRDLHAEVQQGVGETADADEPPVTVQREGDVPFWEQYAQRREREHRGEQHARDEAEVQQDELERIGERTRVLLDEQRPRRPEPGEDEQRPDEDLRAKQRGGEHEGIQRWNRKAGEIGKSFPAFPIFLFKNSAPARPVVQ
jgi:hypothetical protein